jgi:hypothetical protein
MSTVQLKLLDVYGIHLLFFLNTTQFRRNDEQLQERERVVVVGGWVATWGGVSWLVDVKHKNKTSA